MELTQSVSYDLKKPVQPKPLFGAGGLGDFNNLGKLDEAKIYDELFAERHMIASELAQQMSSRIKSHLYLKERKPTDFVQPKRSEIDMFNQQSYYHGRSAELLEEKLTKLEDTFGNLSSYKE